MFAVTERFLCAGYARCCADTARVYGLNGQKKAGRKTEMQREVTLPGGIQISDTKKS